MKKHLVYLILLTVNLSISNVSLPAIFSNGMVLQQNAEMKFWGWGSPLEKLKIATSWDSAIYETEVDNYANWEINIKTPKAGGPYKITIQGYNEITLDNILIGEVWLCSGQSNMAMTPSAGITDAQELISKANFPNIRFFNVTTKSANTPQVDVDGNWVDCNPNTMKNFSAVSYFFGKKIHEDLNVPVGLIFSGWGGTPIEAWMPSEVINSDKNLLKGSELLAPTPYGPHKPAKAYNAMLAPLIRTAIAGVIWYQGEDNTVNPDYYEAMFSALINSWRDKWKLDFPFFYAQIAPFDYGNSFVGVKVREAQRRTLKIPKTGMIVTSDISSPDDIHPKNKSSVGLRLANLALKHHYKTMNDLLVDSPLFDKVVFTRKKAIVSFLNSDGLYLKPKKTSLFEIAGPDKIFYPAKFKLKNNKIIANSKKVSTPKFVRFAWGNTSASNLFNSAHLPASSFTTEY